MHPLARLLTTLSILTLLVMSSLGEEISKLDAATNSYYDTIKSAQTAFRKTLGESLAEGTKMEIYLLDFDLKRYTGTSATNWKSNLPKDQFPIGPYKKVTRILKTKTLDAEEMKKLLPSLQATVGVEKNSYGAMCHFPIHGLRVWMGYRLILETSFCWMCGNFSLEYPDFSDSWVGLEGTKLKEIMNELMPIPKAETERFKKSMPNQDLLGK
ncbi:MAG: hypothetical protein ABJF10_12825 [Chthoniobacter sp.]|uniref:hypothetical protein n=1 Tax=Chthoniobacter sp. TaxID=2510640 RepID=UPI0032A49C21